MSNDKKGYIAFLDLLGTKNFTGNPGLYYENILTFFDTLNELSISYLENKGKVCFFSDCAYIETVELESIIKFLIAFRDCLCTYNLFFNAAITEGNLGIVNAAEKDNRGLLYGVSFKDSSIANAYVQQNSFKGIGIYIDKNIKIPDELSKYVVKSVFLENDKEKGYRHKEYKDLRFDIEANSSYDDFATKILSKILKECFLASTKSEKYGRYYLSILSTLINSYDNPELQWNTEKHIFNKAPDVYHTILKIARNDVPECPNILGLDYLCFFIIDKAYSCLNVEHFEKIDIANTIMNYPCIKNKYGSSLETIPEIFNTGVRDNLIYYYQNSLMENTVKKLIK